MSKVTIRQLLSRTEPKVGNVRFIAIDGRGGSGKSTLAGWLSRRLGASVIQTDDFASWDNPLDWWPLLIERVFEPIRNGAKVLTYSQSGQWWEGRQPQPVTLPVTNIMILEGVSSSRKEFRDYISVSIFIDTSRALCLRRGVERDEGYNTGKTKEEIEEMWNSWCEAEDAYIQRDNPKAHADIVLDGTKPFEEQAGV